jgi:hypothetical protein
MPRRFRPTDAFVDESIRGPRYLMGCVLVEAKALPEIRRELLSLVDAGKRLHFHEELDSVRRSALETFAAYPLHVVMTLCFRTHGVSEFHARSGCLASIVERLQDRRVSRLTIESRQDDRDDRRTIARARQPEPHLVFDHRLGQREPLLWIADAVTWAYGAGGKWLPLVDSIIDEVVELQP